MEKDLVKKMQYLEYIIAAVLSAKGEPTIKALDPSSLSLSPPPPLFLSLNVCCAVYIH